MQTHLVERPMELDPILRGRNPTHVIISVKPLGRAVVFIHGFGGHSLSTWSEFNNLLPLEREADGVDLFFYGYNSLRADVRASAGIFCQFLDGLMTNPSGALNPLIISSDLQRPPNFQYREIIVVAHSLGAVVARQALVDACESTKSWTSRIRLILFAPAHCGARAVKLASMLSTGSFWLSFVASLGRFNAPSLTDLEPDSKFLQELARKTSDLTAKGHHRLRPELVVHAELENIVETIGFAGDPPARETLAGMDHMAVCKPRSSPRNLFRPLEIIQEILRA
jgi:pimeloyl-ACP methyl ester carboxylesterase